MAFDVCEDHHATIVTQFAPGSLIDEHLCGHTLYRNAHLKATHSCSNSSFCSQTIMVVDKQLRPGFDLRPESKSHRRRHWYLGFSIFLSTPPSLWCFMAMRPSLSRTSDEDDPRDQSCLPNASEARTPSPGHNGGPVLQCSNRPLVQAKRSLCGHATAAPHLRAGQRRCKWAPTGAFTCPPRDLCSPATSR